ncbi:hypothetical protein LINGRAHAP2_LOCUS24577 [Linum grandiflorum]
MPRQSRGEPETRSHGLEQIREHGSLTGQDLRPMSKVSTRSSLRNEPSWYTLM